MSRLKTLPELVNQPLMTKADIRRVFRVGTIKAKNLFDRAATIDDAILPFGRPFDNKVRTKTILTLLGIEDEEMKKSVLPYAQS